MAPAAIRTLFTSYDRAFAAALGASVVKVSSDEGYKIAFIVSNTWWNDDFDFYEDEKPKKAVSR